MQTNITPTEVRLHFLDYLRVIKNRWVFVLVILVVVVILSIILWLIDMALGKVILDWLLNAKG